jgi:hypothetical protein
MPRATKSKRTQRLGFRSIQANITSELPGVAWEKGKLKQVIFEHLIAADWVIARPDDLFSFANQKPRVFREVDARNFLLNTVTGKDPDPDLPGYSDWFKPFDLFDAKVDPCPARTWAKSKGITSVPRVNLAYRALRKLSRHYDSKDPQMTPLGIHRQLKPGDKKSTVWRIKIGFNYERWDELAKKLPKGSTN